MTDTDARESALRALLTDQPGAVVATINPSGLFVDTPDSLDFGRFLQAQARSALDLADASSRGAIMEAWDRCLADGAAFADVVVVGGGAGRWYFFDCTAVHGVLVGVLVCEDGTASLQRAAQVVAPPPRTARLRKDHQSFFVAVDDAAVAMLGWSRDQLVGGRSIDFVHEDDHGPAVSAWMDCLARPGGMSRLRFRNRRGDGTWLWVEVTNHNLLEDPDAGYVDCEMVDISDEMAAHEAVRSREELFSRLAGALPVGVVQFDGRGALVYANERLYAIFGTELGASSAELRACVADPDQLASSIEAALDGADVDIEVRVEGANNTGGRRCAVTMRALHDQSGRVAGVVAVVNDITEAARFQDELEDRATYDALTGCINRSAVVATLDAALRAPGRGVAAVFVDLDGFKSVNDTFGHNVGDTLLVTAAARMREAVRAGDVVGRLGGDEFLAVCADTHSPADAAVIAARIADVICGPVTIDGCDIELRASVGVSWVETGTDDAETVIGRADVAMYRSKKDGACRAVVAGEADPGRDRRRHRPARGADSLRAAMAGGELEVHFQPILSLPAQALAGCEALLRWRRGGRLIPATDFIVEAEQTGLICEVGPWLIDEVCRQVDASGRRDLTWFVNMSPRGLAAPRTLRAVSDALDRHGVASSCLVVEVTEHSILADGGVAADVLRQLDELGVGIALDDFGAGCSSLTSVLSLPVSWLKADRLFAAEITSPRGAAVVAGVVEIARRAGIRTVAEGVETAAQLEAVTDLGIDWAQGHLLCRPGPLGEVLAHFDRARQ